MITVNPEITEQSSLNEPFDCENCGRAVVSTRFAAHLEKCMGMGRNSGRIASQRLASAAGRAKKSDEDHNDETKTEEIDADWDPEGSEGDDHIDNIM